MLGTAQPSPVTHSVDESERRGLGLSATASSSFSFSGSRAEERRKGEKRGHGRGRRLQEKGGMAGEEIEEERKKADGEIWRSKGKVGEEWDKGIGEKKKEIRQEAGEKKSWKRSQQGVAGMLSSCSHMHSNVTYTVGVSTESHGDTPQQNRRHLLQAFELNLAKGISAVTKHDYHSVLCPSYLPCCRLRRDRGFLKTRTRGGENERETIGDWGKREINGG